jgi:phage terminase large subunit-like protein
MAKYDLTAEPFNPDDLLGRECYGGLDLASTDDIAAFILVFPPDDPHGDYFVLPHFWIPGDMLHQRVTKDHVPYDQWRARGFLETTEGNVINYNFIQYKIEELSRQYLIREIAFDRWGAHLLSQNLDNAGFKMIRFGQGYESMSPPCKELMRLVLEKRIAHAGNPVLRWNYDNIVVRQDEAGNIKPDKEKATEKIDGAVAMIMALDRAIKQETHGSIYDKRSIISYGADGWRGLD